MPECKSTITIDTRTFFVEVARTPEEMKHGLERRESLAIDHGMLLIFADASKDLNFYMEEVYFPLDMIFILGNTIVSLEKEVPPLLKNEQLIFYNPPVPADKVLEINA